MGLRPQPGLCWKRVISPTGCEVILAQEHLRFLILDGHPFHLNIECGSRRDALRRVRVWGSAATTKRGPPGVVGACNAPLQVCAITVQQNAAGVRGVPDTLFFVPQEWGLRGLTEFWGSPPHMWNAVV